MLVVEPHSLESCFLWLCAFSDTRKRLNGVNRITKASKADPLGFEVGNRADPTTIS